MKRWILGAVLGAAALVGCRAIVGIDDLRFDPGAPSMDGGLDAGDGGKSDSGATQQIQACQQNQQECRQCCKMAFPSVSQTFERGAQRDCICDPQRGNCSTACATSICSPAPIGTQPDRTCAKCEDDVLSRRDSPCGADQCGDQGCVDGIRCLQSCQ